MPSQEPRALIRYALTGFAVTLILLWAAYLAREALLLIYIAALVAMGLSPVVAAIERRRRGGSRVPRWAAILAVYLAIIGTLVAIGLLVFPPLVEQARELWERLPAIGRDARGWLVDRGVLSADVSVREAVEQTGGADAVNRVAGALWGVVGGVFGLVTILILAFYLLVDKEHVLRSFIRLFPVGERDRVAEAGRRVTTKVSAWLGGQLLLAAIISGTAALALWLLGIPYFYVLALLAGLGELIPIIGPILAAIPAIAVAFTVSPASALFVAVFFLLQQQVENHVLVPKIMERQVGISAVTVIASLLVAGSLLGIVGAILAVPTAAIVQVLVGEILDASDNVG